MAKVVARRKKRDGQRITIQIVPKAGINMHELLCGRIESTAQTWYWADRRSRKTLAHIKNDYGGVIRLADAEGILIASVDGDEMDEYFLLEKFVGRLIAWFPDEISAINIQVR